MYVIETRYFKDEHIDTVLCIDSTQVFIQKRDENDAILEEWFIPFIKMNDLETNFKISEKFLKFIKKSSFIIVYKNFFETQHVRINFNQEEFLCWDTFTDQKPTCILEIPKLEHDMIGDEDHIIFSIEDNKLFMCIEKNTTFIFEPVKIFCEGTVNMFGYYIKEVFEKHTGKVCKLYVQKDNPLCLEFCDGYRIFIAPAL
tara:strand:+ start:819 stop:1418 length:600 start_codon:yes stop_codon:yes gene_type:complete